MLKPCPFCNAEYEKDEDDFVYAADHDEWCPLRGTAYGGYGLTVGHTEREIAAWNQRAERTCKVRQSYFDNDDELSELMEGIAFSPEDTVACICDTCNHDWRYDRGIRPNYCPNCGARVVGD